jgi:hypothetical protein
VGHTLADEDHRNTAATLWPLEVGDGGRLHRETRRRRGDGRARGFFFYYITHATALGQGAFGPGRLRDFFSGANSASGMNHTTHFFGSSMNCYGPSDPRK